MPTIRLTSAIVAQLTVPDPSGKPTEYWDDTLPGFGVRVGRKRKSYEVSGRCRGAHYRYMIGQTRLISFEKAKVTARDILRNAADGIHPHAERIEQAETAAAVDSINKFFRGRRRPDTPTDYSGVVYFVAIGDSIKIGFSNDITGRMRGLQTGAPDTIKLIAVLPGDRKLEQILHERFSDVRLSGEFFKPESVLAFLSGIGRSFMAQPAAKETPRGMTPSQLTQLGLTPVDAVR